MESQNNLSYRLQKIDNAWSLLYQEEKAFIEKKAIEEIKKSINCESIDYDYSLRLQRAIKEKAIEYKYQLPNYPEIDLQLSKLDNDYRFNNEVVKLNGFDVVRDSNGVEIVENKKRYSKKDISKVEIKAILEEMVGERA